MSIPSGPFTWTATLGISFAALPRDCVCGRSIKFRDTSGGIDIGAPPTRDCAGDVVEKHCARSGCERAGTRNEGTALFRRGSRISCLKQLRDSAHDMADYVAANARVFRSWISNLSPGRGMIVQMRLVIIPRDRALDMPLSEQVISSSQLLQLGKVQYSMLIFPGSVVTYLSWKFRSYFTDASVDHQIFISQVEP
jgi:hypothetical protein